MDESSRPDSHVTIDDAKTMPVVQEEVLVGKRKKTIGMTRVTKTVEEREETVDEPLLREEVQIERIPVNRFVEKALPVRHEDDTTIIPVFEEVMVVEKRLLLKEEIRIRKTGSIVHDPRKVRLRTESAEVEHAETGDREEASATERRKE